MPPAGDVPEDLRALVTAVSSWDESTRALWMTLDTRSVYQRVVGLGAAIADAIRLQRAVRTRRIDRWLAAITPEQRTTFETWRTAFFVRCDAIGALTVEGLIACDFAMAEEGVVAMARRNPRQIAAMVSERPTLGATLAVVLGTARLVFREWKFFGSFFARQLRRSGLPLCMWRANRIMRRLNDKAGRTIVTHRNIDPLLSVYEALEERGVRGDADSIVLSAMLDAEERSGKPWKGLFRLYELVMYSGVGPRDAEWGNAFREAMTGPIVYTHVPGREWIVRDYRLGKRLMQVDGKIDEGDQLAGLQQGRGSLATGYIRGGHVRVEFGRRYSKPLKAFLDSMVVAEGADHQRQRKAFLPFFTQPAVLEHAGFVEETVRALLDDAAGCLRACRRPTSRPKAVMRRRPRLVRKGGSICGAISRIAFRSGSSPTCSSYHRRMSRTCSIGPRPRCARWTPTPACHSRSRKPARSRPTRFARTCLESSAMRVPGRSTAA